jgi:hypothetical protein
MWRRLILARTDFSEKRIALIIRVKIISELETTLAAISYWKKLRRYIEISTRATRRHIPEDDILYSHCREVQKSYVELTSCIL